MSVSLRNNVKITGFGSRPMMFAHGFGCDQNMWRLVAPAFEAEFKIVLFDHVGAGQSDLTAYSRSKYGTLKGYADDILEICRELDLEKVIFVGHSVSAMIGVLAAIEEPERFSALVMVGPSPCYINDGEYHGGFSREEIGQLLEFLDSNYLGWASAMAPQIMGNPDRPELSEELSNSFCRTDPEIAQQFARVTFLSDNRADLDKLRTPSLIIQCSNDVIAPMNVGEYVGNLVGALEAYRNRLTISKTLLSKDGSNKQWRKDLDYIIDHIGSLAYSLILESDFGRALEAADEALSVSPDRAVIYGNRAHALMFLGRADEARAIYVQYRGKSNVTGEKTWEMTILDNFAELREAGLEHPLMDEIVTSFEKTSATPQSGLVQDQVAP